MKAEERGVALLTVLLLVAVMSVLAVSVLDEIRFAIRRTANAEAVGQARWYALGAETLAGRRIADVARTGAPPAIWSRPLDFPVDGGVIRARLEDGAACFNLNSVVAGAGDVLQKRPEGVRQFVALAAAVGLAQGEAEGLAASLVDWIDSDPLRESRGAEDEAYGGGGEGYLTGATLLAEPSELRAVRGFTPQVYTRLRPHVCALPTTALSPINLNALTPDQAVLLTALTDGRLSPASARRVIEARPQGGWTSVADFLVRPELAQAPPTSEAANQLQVRSRYFRLETEVDYGDAEAVSTALFEQDAAGQIRLTARRWGPEE